MCKILSRLQIKYQPILGNSVKDILASKTAPLYLRKQWKQEGHSHFPSFCTEAGERNKEGLLKDIQKLPLPSLQKRNALSLKTQAQRRIAWNTGSLRHVHRKKRKMFTYGVKKVLKSIHSRAPHKVHTEWVLWEHKVHRF